MTSSKGKKTGNGAEPASYPLRVACVDMGSNAIRFLAAEFSNRKISLRFVGEEQS